VRRLLAVVLAVLGVALLVAPAALAQTTEADVFVGQAILDLDDRRYEDALRHLGEALALEPDHVEALYYMGLVHLAQQRRAEAIRFLEQARGKAPTDVSVAFQLGSAYFAGEQYDRAQPLLEEVFRARPDLDGLGYYVGFLRYNRQDYRGALRAFRGGRASDPEIQQLIRVYTGLALAAVGLPGQAIAEVEQALRLAPGSPLTGPAERLRDTVVAARQHERRFSGEVRAGAFYDDNVRVVPDISPDPNVLAMRRQSRRSRDSLGELFGARAEYMWWRTEDWESSVGYSFFLSYYNDIPSFNITDHLATGTLIGKTSLGAMPLQAGVQYAFDMLFLDEAEFVRRHTVTAFGALAESRRHLTQLLARYQNKAFNETPATLPEESRDADAWMVGGQHFLRFVEDRHFLKLGYQVDWDDPAGRNYAYHGYRLLGGAQATLRWREIRLRYDFDLHLRRHEHPHTLLPASSPGRLRRNDKEFTHTVRVEVPLPGNLTLSAEYLKIINESNLEAFDYARNVTSLTLSWTY
jgi:tetratricopeptide (TPR) repeat protein